jgi:hypothetical protein
MIKEIAQVVEIKILPLTVGLIIIRIHKILPYWGDFPTASKLILL